MQNLKDASGYLKLAARERGIKIGIVKNTTSAIRRNCRCDYEEEKEIADLIDAYEDVAYEPRFIPAIEK